MTPAPAEAVKSTRSAAVRISKGSKEENERSLSIKNS